VSAPRLLEYYSLCHFSNSPLDAFSPIVYNGAHCVFLFHNRTLRSFFLFDASRPTSSSAIPHHPRQRLSGWFRYPFLISVNAGYPPARVPSGVFLHYSRSPEVMGNDGSVCTFSSFFAFSSTAVTSMLPPFFPFGERLSFILIAYQISPRCT